ncbi:MAG: hypothetical protein ABS79_06365 [Planctomycetes bacterium SCN 63-9]|nr:MAG: hypothetical protein ABS79_06365 [Planctomycetes bacterium SCN 63-9]
MQAARRTRILVGFLLFIASLPAVSRAQDSGEEFFERSVRPVLVARCYSCHSSSAKSVKGGLRLDNAAAIRRGGDSGEIIIPGKPDESLLLEALAHQDGAAAMPPDGKLPEKSLADFRRWVEIGAPIPPDRGDSRSQSADEAPKSIDFAKGRRFWSLRPITEPKIPEVSDPRWCRGRIDRFILQGLDGKRLTHSPEADRRTLLRRLSFDLTGLPPTLEEIARFEADASPLAYEREVERLLASPHYGERWGRHWLDVARFAEDNNTGEATNKAPRVAHPYRDWVIRAINRDLPYDQFVRRQLAADLIPGLPPSEIAGLGFLGHSPVYHKEPKLSAEIITGIVAEEWDERIDTVTRGFLGLTVACARCHDHKFDPIGTEDYYAIAGVMAGTQIVERPLVETDPVTERALADLPRRLVDLDLRLGYAREQRGVAIEQKQDPAPFDRRIADLKARIDELKKTKLFAGPTAMAVRDAGLWVDGSDPSWTWLDYRPGIPRDLPVFRRGSPSNPGPIVPRRFLAVFSNSAEPPRFSKGSGRLELADGIVGSARGLTARVLVNRVWGWHFGRPLVATPSNFGKLGDTPSHPELLEDLAGRFIAGGWSLKALHREIVGSATYRQSSRHDGASQAIDPENRLLWRAQRSRLDVEAWRDAILAIVGTLDSRMEGPSGDLESDRFTRRTLYARVSRQRLSSVLQTFDFPDPKRHGEVREQTTTPLQQLYFFNSPFLLTSAESLANQVCKESTDLPERVRSLYRRILLRNPSADEHSRAMQLVKSDAADSREGYALLAQTLLISNEFLFVD